MLVPLLLFLAACWYDRVAVERAAHDRLVSTTDALAAHAEAVFQTASLALTLQLGAIKDLDWPAIDRSPEIHRFLQGLDAELPQVTSAFYVDPSGRNAASSRAFPMPPYDVTDREYLALARQAGGKLVVSSPFAGRAGGSIGFVVARARMRDGVFDGLAGVTLSPAYFRTLYESLLPWPDSSAAMLLRGDGTVLAHYPQERPVPPQLPPDSPLIRAIRTRQPMLTFESVAPVDERPKYVALRRVPDQDVLVVYSIDKARALAPWYQHVALFAAFAIVAGLALSLTARFALRRAAREQASLHALLTETERRQRAEASLQQMHKIEALGRLTGGVAHDFNNLLAAILGSLELALRRVQEPRVVRLLQAATQAAERGARLTAQMLAFARKQPLTLEAVDANAVIRGMDEMLQRSTGPLIRLAYRLQPGVWPVLADRVQLEVALLNLVGNARDAMKLGGEVTLRSANLPAAEAAARGLPPNDHVELAVVDTGEGMTEAVRAAAFEPFFTTKGPGKGTGLGLSMAYGFASQSGGSIQIDSAPGAGTTVRLFLPCSETAVEVEPDAPVASADGGIALHVLLVDDDDAVRAPTREMLQEAGHTVVDVASGAEALTRLQGPEAFDAMLVDFAMPEMNGGELAVAVRRTHPDLPIVFITGYADDTLLHGWTSLGSHTLGKPFTAAALTAALRGAVAHSPAAAQD